MDDHDTGRVLPDYRGGGIVNLMASLLAAFGGEGNGHPTAPLLPPQRLAAARKVVLLVVDGLGYRFLQRHGGGGWLRRHLVAPLTSVFPATTASAATTLLTGAAPQQHGVTGWFVHFKELGGVAAVLPFRPRQGGSGYGGVDPVAFFANRSLAQRLPLPVVQVVPGWIAGSAFNRAHGVGCTQLRYHSLNGFGNALGKALKGREPRLVYAYWAGLDGVAHEHGIDNAATLDHFAALDRLLGRLLDPLPDDDTLVVATADHGLIDTAPELRIDLADHPRLGDTLVLPLCGEPRAAYCYVHPQRQAAFVEYVETRLGHAVELHESRRLVAEGWFGQGAAHPRLWERIGHYTLVAKGRYTIKDWVAGEGRYDHVGVHGGVSAEEMEVPLIVAGG